MAAKIDSEVAKKRQLYYDERYSSVKNSSTDGFWQ